MHNLGELLGQDNLALELLDVLETPGVRVARLTGPAGSGKSHVALTVGATWRENGGRCVVAVGDPSHATRSLYPLLSGLSVLPRDWSALAGQGSRAALQTADNLTRTGGAATSIFDLLSSFFRQGLERSLRPFSNVERGIILDLRRLARRRPLLLVVDNAHWWDADSLLILLELLSDELRASVNHLDSLVVLLVDTADEQEPASPELFDTLLERCGSPTWRTSPCTRGQFSEVLRDFGLNRDLPDDVLDALFSATGGHLKLCEQVAAYAESDGIRESEVSDESDYVARLLTARIDTLGTASKAISALLGRAAVIGLSFDENELLCLAEELDLDVPALISQAEAIRFLRRAERRISFAHDILRSAFLDEETPATLAEYRRKFEECLSILRPGDYAARAEVLLDTGDAERGREMYALAAIDQLRKGAPARRLLREVTLRFPSDTDLHNYMDTLAEGYAGIATGDFRSVLPRLRTPSASESVLMAAERNYVVAICSMELQTAPGFEEARSILSSWQTAVRSETELSLRYLLLQQQAQVLSDSFDEARATERTIERRLIARARHDQDAAVMLQIQNRRSAAIDVPEIAEQRIGESVAFFRRGTGQEMRDRRELYRSLNNLAGIQIRLGKNAEAYATAREAERIAIEVPESVARLDVLASNLVLAGLRSEAIAVTDAVGRQELIIQSSEGGDDKFVHRCNLAAYLMLSGDDEPAARELVSLQDELVANEFTESYLVFYWSALDVAASLLRGDVERAVAKHAAMEPFVENLKWPCAPYVRRRQRLLSELLPLVTPDGDRIRVDEALLARRPFEIGAAWSYYARLIPCCELDFWSDS
jgi:hypothetical protein